MPWRELPLTAQQLRDNGLGVMSVWSPSQNAVPQVVYVRWQHQPEPYEIGLAEHFLLAKNIRHLGPKSAPKGCPWAVNNAT